MIIKGYVARYLIPNTDTDVIIPARFLKRTSLDGFEQFAFFEKRYLPETTCEPTLGEKDYVFQKKVMNEACTLNHKNSKSAHFLLTWCNFGCGSSREHAVYALKNYKVIIGSAPKGKSAFADIFRDNCRQNLIWTPVISPDDHQRLNELIDKKINEGAVELSLYSKEKKIIWEDGGFECDFELPEHHFSYILAGEDPFVQARHEISDAIAEIDAWVKKNTTLLIKSPSTNTF